MKSFPGQLFTSTKCQHCPCGSCAGSHRSRNVGLHEVRQSARRPRQCGFGRRSPGVNQSDTGRGVSPNRRANSTPIPAGPWRGSSRTGLVDEGEFGVAETLSKAKNTSIDGIVEGGILASKGGKVRLLRPVELAGDWDPTTDKRLTVWEAVHYLVDALESGGESTAADVGPSSSAGLLKPPANWLIDYMLSVSAKTERRKPDPITASCKAGPKSLNWRGNEPRRSRASCLGVET